MKIERRPVLVVEGSPDGMVTVDRDWIVDPQVFDGLAHIGQIFLKREFRRVDADHYQALIAIFLVPHADIGERSQPVDAGVGSELDEDDLSAQG